MIEILKMIVQLYVFCGACAAAGIWAVHYMTGYRFRADKDRWRHLLYTTILYPVGLCIMLKAVWRSPD